MNKNTFIATISVLFFFVFAGFVFAQGKITPFNWDKPVNPDELGEPALLNNATSTETEIASVSILGLSPEILQPDGTWKKITSGEDLKNGGDLRIGEGSSMVITFTDGSEVVIGEFSVIKLQAAIFNEVVNTIEDAYIKTLNALENELSLLIGRIKANITKRSGKKIQVRTIEAVCAIRGTDFIVERDANKKTTYVYLYEGLIDVDNLHGKTLLLQPGETVSVDSDGAMTTGKLAEGQWDELVNEITPDEIMAQNKQPGPAKQEPAGAKTTNKILIFGLIAAVILAIGAGVFLYRKKS